LAQLTLGRKGTRHDILRRKHRDGSINLEISQSYVIQTFCIWRKQPVLSVVYRYRTVVANSGSQHQSSPLL
jgi:hypothetical protein